MSLYLCTLGYLTISMNEQYSYTLVPLDFNIYQNSCTAEVVKI